jgi:hypothetical protein
MTMHRRLTDTTSERLSISINIEYDCTDTDIGDGVRSTVSAMMQQLEYLNTQLDAFHNGPLVPGIEFWVNTEVVLNKRHSTINDEAF